MDIVCVLAQLAGTALTITFGDLVQIGQKVSHIHCVPQVRPYGETTEGDQLIFMSDCDSWSLGPVGLFPSHRRGLRHIRIQSVCTPHRPL